VTEATGCGQDEIEEGVRWAVGGKLRGEKGEKGTEVSGERGEKGANGEEDVP
jgi:hypothetical protein